MEHAAKKRVRSSNWDEEEKRLLIQLVTDRIDVIENKDTSMNTNSKKKAAWQDVLSNFNSLQSKKRDLQQLMTQWRNTKGKVKSREYEYRRARLMTGGGPPPPSPPAEDLAILNAIPNEFVVDSNCYDSDSVYLKTIKQAQQPDSSIIKNDCYDPGTPLTLSNNKMSDSEEGNQIPEVLEQLESENVLTATPVSTMKSQINMRTRHPVKRVYKKINNTNEYEKELFLLALESKKMENERAKEMHRRRMSILDLEDERAEEIHKKRMSILDLEEDYWKKKSNTV